MSRIYPFLSHGWVSFKLAHLWGLRDSSSQWLLEDVKIVDWSFRAVIVLRWYLWVPMKDQQISRGQIPCWYNLPGALMSLSLRIMNTGLFKPLASHWCTRISPKWIWGGSGGEGIYREDGVVGEMKGIPDGRDSSVRRAENTEWGTSHGQIRWFPSTGMHQPPPNKVALTCAFLHMNSCTCDKSKAGKMIWFTMNWQMIVQLF